MYVCIVIDLAQLVGVNFLTTPLINSLLAIVGIFLQDCARCPYTRSVRACCLAPQCKHNILCQLIFTETSDFQKCFHVNTLKADDLRSIYVIPAWADAWSSTNNAHLIPLIIEEVLFAENIEKRRGRKQCVINNRSQPAPSSSFWFFPPWSSHQYILPSLRH